MGEKVILLLCLDPFRAGPLLRELEDLGLGGLWCVGAVEEAVEVQGQGQVEVVLSLVDVSGGAGVASVCEMLASCSSARRPVPVVALSDRYDQAEALTLFQMGVADYLSLADHRHRLPGVIASLVARAGLSECPSGRPARRWRMSQAHVASWAN
jgi:DNA-binding NarL/FixJ family response regulator